MFTVISLLALLVAAVTAQNALAAETVGKVANLNGPLFDQKTDGTIMTLAQNSGVEVGDTLVAEKRTYARIKFIDDSEVILRPSTQFKVETLSYDQNKPATDKAVMSMVKGGLRAITGQIGKRGSGDDYQMKTVAATIGIRGTIYETRACDGNCGSLKDGVYFYVVQGSIVVSNNAGSVVLGPGQSAYAPDANTMPVILPTAPELDFMLPEWVLTLNETPWVWTISGEPCRSCEVR